MLWMSMTTITIILLVAVQSMFGSTTTHALPWAGVGQTEPQWPVVLFLKNISQVIKIVLVMVMIYH